ncbi:MAG: F0F1 ATP synthase subunit A [Bacteroidota bacterium]
MNDPNAQPLLAQDVKPADTITTAQHQTGEQPATAAEHGAKPGEKETGNVFKELLGELGDHRHLSFGNHEIVQLPVILFDGGLRVYSSVETMEEGGEYELSHVTHHIVRKGTEVPPKLDMSVTSLVAFQWVAMVLLAAILIPMGRKYKKRGAHAPRGFFNAMEAVVLYVRDQIVLPNTGDAGKKLLPIFLTIFFFILTMNLVGLVPGGHSSTGSLNVTAGLAIIAFVVIQAAAINKNGLGSWLKHLTGGVPVWLWPIMVPVEILGLFTKPFALCVRLFANMTAGHVILLSLIGLSFVTAVFIPVTLGFSLFINILELLVAFIQAYIFTMLTAVFAGIGMASHDDHGHGGSEHAAAH